MYVKDHPGKWDDYLHLVEFAYNNNYHTSARLVLLKFYMDGNVILLSIGAILWIDWY